MVTQLAYFFLFFVLIRCLDKLFEVGDCFKDGWPTRGKKILSVVK